MKKIFLWISLALFFMAGSCVPPNHTISGNIQDTEGRPVPGAVVRVKATQIETISGPQGEFSLAGLSSAEPLFVTAWASGYYINGIEEVFPGDSGVEIVLQAHHQQDHPEYAWLPSTVHAGVGEHQGCAECHSRGESALDFALPVDEWLQDAHSQSAANTRFLSMYLGQDLEGNQSPPTRYTIGRDYGRFPLRPDLSQPYFGPGYKLDFPDTAGNCAACHTPLPAVNDPFGVDPTQLTATAAEGISCDFCHKVWDVRLDPASGLPYANMPGVLSLAFLRPPDGHQFFAGPLDDVAPGEDTLAPVQRESQFCAPCHFGVFWDTTIYNSYGEWLSSPYSDPDTGKTCQDCHMPALGSTHFALPEQGGVARDPQTIFSHRMPGASDETLLQNAVNLEARVQQNAEKIIVDVTITNDQTGHHIPTDSPLRHLILLVRAENENGETLERIDGPVLPEWCGVGSPAEGYYAGLPGKSYAKILMEMWTEVTPTAAYWNPTQVLSDNRLAAFETDTSSYVFVPPEQGEIKITITLLFRRAYIELMDQKGWDVPDIQMEEQILFVR